MGLLEKNKKEKKENKNVVLPTRLTQDEYDKFSELCQSTGHTMSEAVRMLIQNELNPSKPAPQKQQVERVEVPTYDVPLPPVETVSKPKPRSYTPSSGELLRFTTEKWKIGNFLPCPICMEWASASNFSRHAKTTHNMTTKELFNTHQETADQMVKERLATME